MIDHIDLLLRQFFLAEVAELTSEAQIGFEPPNAAWRQGIVNLNVDGEAANAINVYLVDIRDARELRSNAVERSIVDGVVSERRAAPRIDLHFLVSAWTPEVQGAQTEPTIVEHRLLGAVVSALFNGEPLLARSIYAPTPLPAGFPAEIADHPLALTVLPVAGFDKIADFWNTMNWHWKPVVYFILKTPVVLEAAISGHPVRTRMMRTFASAGAAPGEPFDSLIQIAGEVNDAANPLPGGGAAPMVGALVLIGTVAGVTYDTTTSDDLGRFTFRGLSPGTYRLRASVAGRGEVMRDVAVPSNEYDLTFN